MMYTNLKYGTLNSPQLNPQDPTTFSLTIEKVDVFLLVPPPYIWPTWKT